MAASRPTLPSCRREASGAVSVYVSDTTNVVLDIDGYFEPASGSTLAFYPLTPCRVADTRKTTGDWAGRTLLQNSVIFRCWMRTACNIPDTAQAYSLNFTAIPRGDQSWVFKCGRPDRPQPGTRP